MTIAERARLQAIVDAPASPLERAIKSVFLTQAVSLWADETVLRIARDIKLFEVGYMTAREEVVTPDYRRLVHELDVALNGENAAKQASLCDLVAQVKSSPISYALVSFTPEKLAKLRDASRGEWRRVTQQAECPHDDTVRQGAIWTKCKQCGKRWADDEVPPADDTVTLTGQQLSDYRARAVAETVERFAAQVQPVAAQGEREIPTWQERLLEADQVAERFAESAQRVLGTAFMVAEISDLRTALAAQPAAAPADAELEFNATRLRNVARLVGLESAIPQDDATLDGARGSVLGLIAGTLRNREAAPVAAQGEREVTRAQSQEWTAKRFEKRSIVFDADENMICGFPFAMDADVVVRSHNAALRALAAPSARTLPERKVVPEAGEDAPRWLIEEANEADGWNACLDAILAATSAPTCRGCDPAEGYCRVCRDAEKASAPARAPSVREQALEEAALACERVQEEFQRRDSGRWPEMRSDGDEGAGACVDAIRALQGKPEVS